MRRVRFLAPADDKDALMPLLPAGDGYRAAGGVAPLELHARFGLRDGSLGSVHILSFADPDLAAVHCVAKAVLRVPAR